MITQNDIKLIRSLALKKNRYSNRKFIVEGKKCIQDLIESNFKIIKIFLTEKLNNKKSHLIEYISKAELLKISFMKSPETGLAIVEIPTIVNHYSDNSSTIVLDNISDPGNLGTIIRLCDWFGVKQIVCSNNTVDIFNPKVVQSSMGSLFRVNVLYTNLLSYLEKVDEEIYGAFLEGNNINNIKSVNTKFHLILGNESNGISKDIERYITKKISVYKVGRSSIDSLNVASATAILLHSLCS